MGEEIAIAEPHTVGEAAASGKRAQLRVDPLAVENKQAPALGKVDGALNAARLVRFYLFGILFAPLPVSLHACLRFL